MKVLILGHGRHGKDTVADMITQLTGLTFKSSSWACAEKAVFPILRFRYGYTTVEECYSDRHNHREEWRQLISDYNTPDKSRLARKILSECDGYVGLRCPEEYAAARPLFDRVLWVDAFDRVPESDPTMGIEFDPSDMIFVDNNLSEQQTRRQLCGIFDKELVPW